MEAKIKGIVLSCQEKQAGTKYACFEVKVFDIETKHEHLFQSPVAVSEKDIAVPLLITLTGLDFMTVNFKSRQTGQPDKFFKISVSGIAGSRLS